VALGPLEGLVDTRLPKLTRTAQAATLVSKRWGLGQTEGGASLVRGGTPAMSVLWQSGLIFSWNACMRCVDAYLRVSRWRAPGQPTGPKSVCTLTDAHYARLYPIGLGSTGLLAGRLGRGRRRGSRWGFGRRLWNASCTGTSTRPGTKSTHFPLGTGKRRATEHRLVRFIRTKWRGTPSERLMFPDCRTMASPFHAAPYRAPLVAL
jgi:hypothetical protein